MPQGESAPVEMTAVVTSSAEETIPPQDSDRTKKKLTEGGYEEIARMIAEFPAVAIYKRFNFLNSLNLLYYQAELTILEKSLSEIAKSNKDSSDTCRKDYFRNFDHVYHGITEPREEDKTFFNAIKRVRKVLKEYNEAVYLGSQIDRLQSPSPSEFQYMKKWLDDDGNGGRVSLSGDDCKIYEDTPMKGMVALYAREYSDFISTWMMERALDWYHRAIGYKLAKKGHPDTSFATTAIYDGKPVMRLVSFLAICFASAAPIVSIVVLYSVGDNMSLRLVLMSFFTIGFSFLCALFTGAKRTDILTASAAFAAVQVVFVSGENYCSCS